MPPAFANLRRLVAGGRPRSYKTPMSLTLHAHPLSSYCWKVLIALYENETEFAFHQLELGDESAVAGYRGRNDSARAFITLIFVATRGGLTDAVELRTAALPKIYIPQIVLIFFGQREIIVKCDA